MPTSTETPETGIFKSALKSVKQSAGQFLSQPELREDLRGFSRWLLVIPVVLVILAACGRVAGLRQPFVAAADTRSKLSADYGAWEIASFAPISIDIISEIRGESQNLISELVTIGDYWAGQEEPPEEDPPSASGTPVAIVDTSTAPASPTRAADQPTGTPAPTAVQATTLPTLTPSAASPSLTSTQSNAPVSSPTSTPTRKPHDESTATSTHTPIPTPTATSTNTQPPTSTNTPTPVPPSATAVPTSTTQPSPTPTRTAVNTATFTPLPTDTPQPTSTPVPPTNTPVPPPTDTPTPVHTPTATPITPMPFETPTPLPPPPVGPGGQSTSNGCTNPSNGRDDCRFNCDYFLWPGYHLGDCSPMQPADDS